MLIHSQVRKLIIKGRCQDKPQEHLLPRIDLYWPLLKEEKLSLQREILAVGFKTNRTQSRIDASVHATYPICTPLFLSCFVDLLFNLIVLAFS